MEQKDIIDQVSKISDWKSLKDFNEIFELHQAKQNLLRVNKVSNLLDVMSDEIEMRVTKYPDDISGRDLTSYYNTAASAVSKAKQEIQQLLTPEILQPKISVTQNILNIGQRSEESKNNVLEAVQELMAVMEHPRQEQFEDEMDEIMDEADDEAEEEKSISTTAKKLDVE